MRLLLVVAAVSFATGCGSSQSLDAEQLSAYVNAQAHALCVVQSHAYPSLAKQEAAYQSERRSKLDDGDLAKADAAARSDETLRRQISERVVALCG